MWGGRAHGRSSDPRAARPSRARGTRARFPPRPRSDGPSGCGQGFLYFGFGPVCVDSGAADPPRILKGGTRMERRGGPGSHEGSDDAIPQGPVPPLLRWVQTDASRAFRAARVRLHVLDRGDRSTPPRILEGRGSLLLSDKSGSGSCVLFERLLRDPERANDGGEGVA